LGWLRLLRRLSRLGWLHRLGRLGRLSRLSGRSRLNWLRGLDWLCGLDRLCRLGGLSGLWGLSGLNRLSWLLLLILRLDDLDLHLRHVGQQIEGVQIWAKRRRRRTAPGRRRIKGRQGNEAEENKK
jgi:hypothetical protein